MTTTQQTPVTGAMLAIMLDVALTHYPIARKMSRSYLLDQLDEYGSPSSNETPEEAAQRIFDFLDSEFRFNFDAAGDLVSPPFVKHSPAGYFIGRDYYDFDQDGELHYDRESNYFKTEESANRTLATGVWWRD